METSATVYYRKFEEEERKRGTLFLLDGGSVVFVTRRLLFFGYEKHHWYGRNDVLKVEAFSDGFKAHVLYPESDDEPEEVISYFYEIDRDVDRWVAALSKTPEQPKKIETGPAPTPQPVIIKEREVIREIVKVKCSHCGNLYDQTLDRCPHCGGR